MTEVLLQIRKFYFIRFRPTRQITIESTTLPKRHNEPRLTILLRTLLVMKYTLMN